jgi:hypothetical protein
MLKMGAADKSFQKNLVSRNWKGGFANWELSENERGLQSKRLTKK